MRQGCHVALKCGTVHWLCAAAHATTTTAPASTSTAALLAGGNAWQRVNDGRANKLCKSTSLPPVPDGYWKFKSGIEFGKTTLADCKLRCESFSWCRFIAVGSRDSWDRDGDLWCQMYDTCSSTEVYGHYTLYKSPTGANRRCNRACLSRQHHCHRMV